MKNILVVTGGAGFIGSNLIEELIPEYPGILQWMINGCLSWQEIWRSHCRSNWLAKNRGDGR
jgi:hypothetical protein